MSWGRSLNTFVIYLESFQSQKPVQYQTVWKVSTGDMSLCHWKPTRRFLFTLMQNSRSCH